MFTIVGIGEVLWDLLPGGPQLGGAPANFTYHACALGADGRLISRLGQDELGRKATERLRALGMALDGVEMDPDRPTGTVSVSVGNDGQPQFVIHENVAWDALAGGPRAKSIVAAANAVCFGTLAQRSEPARSTIRSLVKASPARALRILDVNLRQQYYSPAIVRESLALANVLKLNDTELPRLASMFGLQGDERAQIRQMTEQFSLRCVAYTRGSRGSLLFSSGTWSDQPGIETEVADTVGAGDAFTAALTLGLLNGWDLDRINNLANQVASYVCAFAGATPPMPERFRLMLAVTSPVPEPSVPG